MSARPSGEEAAQSGRPGEESGRLLNKGREEARRDGYRDRDRDGFMGRSSRQAAAQFSGWGRSPGELKRGGVRVRVRVCACVRV
jgi:hypothetical protein